MKPMPRIVVVGGGPAGASAAAVLARHGSDVTLVDKQRFPRHHVGESLQPAAVTLLDEHLGLGEAIASQGFARKYGAVYVWGEHRQPWSVIFDPALERALERGMSEEELLAGAWEMAWQVDRSRFDTLLLNAAKEAGVDVREGAEVVDVVSNGDTVRALTLRDGARIDADLVLDASGQRCLLGHHFGLSELVADMQATATYGYYDGAGGLPGALGRHVQYVYTTEDGWCWFIPISAERTSVGVVTKTRRKLSESELDAILAKTDFPLEGARRVAVGGAKGPLHYARDWSFSNKRFAGGNWLLLGDAACFVDPILSGGVDFAVRTGCRAALVILRARDEPFESLAQIYERDFKREYQAYLRMARYWYGNNRSVEGLFWEAHKEVPADSGRRAFIYLTTGTYAAEQHRKVFAEWQERTMFRKLGARSPKSLPMLDSVTTLGSLDQSAYYVGDDLQKRSHGYAARLYVRGDGVAAMLRRAAETAAAAETAKAAQDHALAPAADPDMPWRANKVLFFESLMSSELPHNDREISQGVLHMASTLAGTPSSAIFANVKMPIVGAERPMTGTDSLRRVLGEHDVHLVCITLLEGYFDGVCALIARIREQGCRAHIAVGGVMPTLSPEHVAAHLPDVSFVCRGAGEYFVPRLARIVGDGDVRRPFDATQRSALMAMDGLLAIDRADGSLIAGNPGRTVDVASLDDVVLDLSHLEPRHIEGGIEISTARGCLHHCSFCTIIGRHRYTARSVDGIFALLGRYQQRFEAMFGEDIPPNAYRVHISDDDFACDAERAVDFLRRLPETPFRLSSLQVSVADLCRRDGRRLLPELDPRFSEVLRPECFADHTKPVPTSDYVADHKTRTWSSYLQIGVETFCDAELTRLAKGYRVAHIRAIVAALAARGIHMDAYFIASNSRTSAEDLIDSLVELARLKLRHPIHFHVRFPIVPHLVSYFPSATYKQKQRRGELDTLALRGMARIDGYPEYDYPFVDHDIPQDPWVAAAVDAGFVDDGNFYTASLERLREMWTARRDALGDDEQRARGERLLRRLDDAPRQLVFDYLGTRRRDSNALTVSSEVLGPSEGWLPAFKRREHEEVPRLVAIPTWQCELRCRYCYIPKQDGRVMSRRTLERTVDMLLTSSSDEVMLQYFGGEPLVESDLVKHGIDYGVAQAAAMGKTFRCVLSSNGWALDEATLAWLAERPVKLELSLDGDSETQNKFRPSLLKGRNSYVSGIASRAAAILASGLPYDVIMVVHPAAAHKLADNFFHIASLGFQRIQVNFMLGATWRKEHQERFAGELHNIGLELRERWRRGEPLVMVNLENPPLPIRLNGEITVDYDGTVYGGNAFLHETEHKDKFAIGHLDHMAGFDRYWLDAPSNDFLLEWSYPPEVTKNNLAVGRIMTSFTSWMQKHA